MSSQMSICGYQIRMENRSGEATRLLYCTTGVLLRKLQQERHLDSLTHIIVDEVGSSGLLPDSGLAFRAVGAHLPAWRLLTQWYLVRTFFLGDTLCERVTSIEAGLTWHRLGIT